jgi:hypothetical protein
LSAGHLFSAWLAGQGRRFLEGVEERSTMAVGLELIQSQLKTIQSDLREMRFAADVDRHNTTSLYNNLAAEFGASIGKLDAKVELGFEIVNERIDQLEERVGRLQAGVDPLCGRIDQLDGHIDQVQAVAARLEGKIEAGFARIEHLLNTG